MKPPEPSPDSTTWPIVLAFAKRMEERLQANMHKGGRENWLRDSPHDLLLRLRDEAEELGETIEEDGSITLPGEEAADVANFAMMIADVCGEVEP